jgi:DNA adenine methylase
MIFISGYANDLYKSLLTQQNGWSQKTIEATTRDSSGQIHKRTEVVWMNKHFLKAQKTNQIAITLTKKESKQKKLNPLRLRVKSG